MIIYLSLFMKSIVIVTINVYLRKTNKLVFFHFYLYSKSKISNTIFPLFHTHWAAFSQHLHIFTLSFFDYSQTIFSLIVYLFNHIFLIKLFLIELQITFPKTRNKNSTYSIDLLYSF